MLAMTCELFGINMEQLQLLVIKYFSKTMNSALEFAVVEFKEGGNKQVSVVSSRWIALDPTNISGHVSFTLLYS